MKLSIKNSAFLRGIKNGLMLLIKGNWREFLVRLCITLGYVDLKDDPTEAVSERTHYYADSGGLAFDKIMSHFDISANDSIVDFGCGKGGILINLSKYPFSRITGIEISPDLVAVAENNLRKLNIQNVNIECCDAAEFKMLSRYNYFYFFDPFPCVVVKDVIVNIEASLAEHPRDMTIIYLNPDCHKQIVASGCFTKTAELSHFKHKCYVYKNVVN